METKREFLKKLGLLTVGGMVSGGMANAAVSNSKSNLLLPKKSIGLQLYSLGHELKKDVPNGLKKVVKIGYSYAEAASYNNKSRKMYGCEIAEFKRVAEDAGLEIRSSHLNPSIREYTKGNMSEILDFWKIAVEDHAKLGVKTLVQPGMPKMDTYDDVAIVCEVFNKAGEIAKEAGLKWGYHNHNHEFKHINIDNVATKPKSNVVYDLMLMGTDPDLVIFEMDVYWTVMGQSDPVEYFKKYAGRFPILHIKDRAVLGQSGMMNFEMIFKEAQKNGLNAYYVELEGIKRFGISQFEGVKESFKYLNNASFVK